MLLVNFKKWDNRTIFITLFVLTLLFALFMPQTQVSKNSKLFEAVMENNVSKAALWIDKGAQKNISIPKGFPLISIAVEFENLTMIKLLMLGKEELMRDYKGYKIMDHVIKTKNKEIIELFIAALEKK